LLKKTVKKIPHGLSPGGTTKIKALCGTAKAVPFQNMAKRDFFSRLRNLPPVQAFGVDS
jgi:hypothetical protein